MENYPIALIRNAYLYPILSDCFELNTLKHSIIKLKILTYLTVLTGSRRGLTPNALQNNDYVLLASSD